MAPFWVKPASVAHIQSLPNSPTPDARVALFGRSDDCILMLDMSALDEEALEAEAARGTALAHDALRTALESREVATATAESLQEQTKQLRGIRNALEDTDRNLDAVEVTVEKLTKSKIRQVAETPARKLRAVGWRRKKNATRGSAADEGVREKDGEGKEGKEVVGRRELFGERIDLLFGRERNVPVEPVDAAAIPADDYKEFSNVKVREQLQQQDRYLDETSVQLKQLKDLALGIHEDIELEAEIIDEIDAPKVTHRIRENHRKITRALRV